MFRVFKNSLLIFLLVFPFYAFGQNLQINAQINAEANTRQSWQIDLQLKAIPEISAGMVLEFPASFNSFPVKVSKNAKLIWLKESDQIPAADNVVHWQRSDSLLVFRFAPGFIVSGDQILMTLHFSGSDTTNPQIDLRLDTFNPTSIRGKLIGRVSLQIPQNPNN
ncbi:MAG: hypothetical protein GXO77_03325 [Calditrichaeota bacterium]|nr:hypothetical protein [Calditrichota bacterium]